MRRSAIGRLLAVAALVSGPLAAQGRDPRMAVDSGKVIRFDTGGVPLRGRLLAPLSSEVDSVPYCRFPGPPCDRSPTAGQVAWLNPASLRHLEVQVGTRAGKGAWIGGVIGVLLTFGGASLAQGFCEYQCPSDAEVLLGSVIVGGFWGGGLGALIGSGFPRLEGRF